MIIFATLALAIAVTGIYGVIAFVVTQRAREIGIRLALGARRAQVVGLLLRHGAALLTSGIAAGLLRRGCSARRSEASCLGSSREI